MEKNPRAEELYQTIADHVADPMVTAWVAEEVLSPLSGYGSPVAPPTYAGAEDAKARKDKTPIHAVSEGSFVPSRSAGSEWYDDVERHEGGAPRRAASVILDSVGSRAGRVESALWGHREDLGGLPAYIVTAPEVPAKELSKVPERLRGEAERTIAALNLSSWAMPHRHADGWIRYATEQGSKDMVRDKDSSIAEFNTDVDATALFRHSPNSILFGFWHSFDSGVRNRQARIYSSEVIGYDTVAVHSGAGRVDFTPMSKDHKIGLGDSAKKPSEVGMGMVPGHPMVRSYQCVLILSRSTISMSALRSIRFGGDETKARTASVALTVMGIVGHMLSSMENTLLRSGCDLQVDEARYGWRRLRSRQVEPLEVPADTQTLIAVYCRAIEEAEQAGLEFASPVQLEASSEQVTGMALHFKESKNSGEGE